MASTKSHQNLLFENAVVFEKPGVEIYCRACELNLTLPDAKKIQKHLKTTNHKFRAQTLLQKSSYEMLQILNKNT